MFKLIKITMAITAAVFALSLVACGFREGLVEENTHQPTPVVITAQDSTQTSIPTPTPPLPPSPSPTPRNNNDLPVNAPDANGLVWLIEPVFEYEKIRYCDCSQCRSHHSLDYTDITDILSVEAVLAENAQSDDTVYIGGGHGGVFDEYFFDEKKGLFIILTSYEGGEYFSFYTPEEFITGRYDTNGRLENIFGNNYAEYFYAIRKIDPEKIIIYEDWNTEKPVKYNLYGQEAPVEGWYDLNGAYTGKFALAYGNTFLTDFIHDNDLSYLGNRGITGLAFEGKWGIWDKNGNTVIPFIFDEIEFIDDAAAFAKYNGKYGILDLRELYSN